MQKEKLLLFLFCVVLFFANEGGLYVVIPILLSISIYSLSEIAKNDFLNVVILSVVLATTFLYSGFIYFIPIFIFQILLTKYQYFSFVSVIPLIYLLSSDNINYINIFFIGLLVFLAVILKYNSKKISEGISEYNNLRDELIEKQLILKKRNKELINKTDDEIHLATLKERARISEELHDSVGHVLTSAILQTGALIATTTDENSKQGLILLKDSLSSGMDEVRASIHNMHDDSVDLYLELKRLTEEFTFAKIHLTYKVESRLKSLIANNFIAIYKEALSNISKHSNATDVSLSVIEHPAFYQFIVSDNGKNKVSEDKINTAGMGIASVRKRVNNMNGKMSIKTDNGFLIFITVPKQSKE